MDKPSKYFDRKSINKNFEILKESCKRPMTGKPTSLNSSGCKNL